MLGMLPTVRLSLGCAPLPVSRERDHDHLARLAGVVVRADNDSALADVEVRLDPTTRVTRTSPDGNFVFDSLPAGLYTISFRRVGFAQDSYSFILREDHNELLRVRLRTLTPTLAEVNVRASSMPLELRAFEKRRADGIGRFIGPEDLRAFAGRAVSSLVQQKIPGFQVVRITRGSLSGGSAIASRRFRSASARRPEEALCFAQVFLNGLRMTRPGGGEPFDVDGLRVEEVLAMEFYRGAAETPTEFNGPMAACGTVVIWTK